MTVSIILPVKNNAATLDELLAAIEAQQFEGDVETVVVDSGSSDGSLDIARRYGIEPVRIPPEEFHHGATRNLAARFATGELLVFASADATPANRRWLAELVRETRREGVAGTYSRQLPRPGASPYEAYFLDHLYGSERRVQRFEGGALGMQQTLFSNVSSCIRRELWERFPFDETAIMSEDQIWSRQVLEAGFALVYSAEAAVYHSHSYTLAGAFRRFFDSGSSSAESYLPPGRGAVVGIAVHGAKYFGGEVRYLARRGMLHHVPYAALYETAKFSGLALGRRRERLPAPLVRRLSYYGRTAR